MPQLDQFTYLTQFVWLCVFYMTFYVLLFNDGLPKISRILKLRAHLCAGRTRNADQGQAVPANVDRVAEVAGIGVESQDVVFRTLNSSISYLNSSVTGAFTWSDLSVDSANLNQLKAMNKSYLRSIGEISLSEKIRSSALEASAPLTFSSLRGLDSSNSISFSSPNGRGLSRGPRRVWALRVQKCLLSSINKKKKKK